MATPSVDHDGAVAVSSTVVADAIQPAIKEDAAAADDTESLKKGVFAETALADTGAQTIELMQQVWGQHGKLWIFCSLALCMIIYEFDNTTFSTYYTYALSDFRKTASSAALAVACNLTFSLLKPVWAKSSDIFGRGEMYPVATAILLVGYIVAATAKSVGAFAAGTILRVIGLTCINTVNTIIVADLTTTRQRGFGVNFQFFPYLILPWISAYIVSSVLSAGGIGWAWGIGIIGIVFPVGVAGIIATMATFQRRAKKLGAHLVERQRLTAYQMASNIDLGGLVILIVSLAFILLPLSLASLQAHGYRTPWVIALMVVGGLGLLAGFPLYENYVAVHPFFPLRYAKHRAIAMACLLYFTDYMAAAASHGYLYNWALIAQGFNIVQATNLSYINSVFTFLIGMVFGLIIWRTRTYKWWIMAGCVIRIIGYAVMFRIRRGHPTMAELFVVQIIQGCGDGIVQTGGYIASTVNVPHRETAQMAALIVTIGMLGSSIGSAISGAIYTGTFRQELAKELGSRGTPELINALFDSINLMVPEWGTADRIAINTAYNTVTSYFFIAALVIIAPGFLLVIFLPNQTLNNQQNLVEEHGILGTTQDMEDFPGQNTAPSSRANS